MGKLEGDKMIDARIEPTTAEQRCYGCAAPSNGDAWWCLTFRPDGFRGEEKWLCLQCAEILGVLLLKERLLSK
jgi:hypothetical protein